MKRNGRLIALGICAAIGAAFAVPSIVGADAPVPLARNSYAVSGFKVSPEGKQPRSIVPTNSKGKFPLRTMDLSQVPWGTTMTGVVGIELLAAAQGCDFHRPLATSKSLEAVRGLVRRDVPHLDNDRYFHPDLAKAIALVTSGGIVDAVGRHVLPAIEGGMSS